MQPNSVHFRCYKFKTMLKIYILRKYILFTQNHKKIYITKTFDVGSIKLTLTSLWVIDAYINPWLIYWIFIFLQKNMSSIACIINDVNSMYKYLMTLVWLCIKLTYPATNLHSRFSIHKCHIHKYIVVD